MVGEGINDIHPIQVALQMAKDQGLDLVEISSKAEFPICKIIDYTKFKYQQKKKRKLIKKKSQKVVVKAIGFSPNTDEHDIAFKTRHAIKFLESQATVSIYVHFSGREIKFKEKGSELLSKVVEILAPYGKQIEQKPKMEGRRMKLTLSPLNK